MPLPERAAYVHQAWQSPWPRTAHHEAGSQTRARGQSSCQSTLDVEWDLEGPAAHATNAAHAAMGRNGSG